MAPHRPPQSPAEPCHPARHPGWPRPAPAPCCAPARCTWPHTRRRGSRDRERDSGDGAIPPPPGPPWWRPTHRAQVGHEAVAEVEAGLGTNGHHNRWTPRQTDAQTDSQVPQQSHAPMDRGTPQMIDGHLKRQTLSRTDRRPVDRWPPGRTDRQPNCLILRRTDRQPSRWTPRRTYSQPHGWTDAPMKRDIPLS